MTTSSIDLARVETTPFEATPAHSQLAALVGAWHGTTSTWLDPSAPPEETATEAFVEAILGGRFLRIQYRGTVMGKPHAGEMLFSYEKDPRAYTLAWVDSFHTSPSMMISSGNGDAAEADGRISVLGHYGPPAERWGWRTVLHLDGPSDAFLLEAFNIAPTGGEDLAVRMQLRRR